MKRIEDMPDNWRSFISPRLQNLAEIWTAHKQRIDQTTIAWYTEQLKRQWAIETGIIENLYTLDRGITRLLVERGIEASLIPHGTTNKPVTHIINLIADQKNVVDGLFDFVGSTRQLSTSYIKEVHAALTAHQEIVDGVDAFGRSHSIPLKRGEWKTEPNNPSRSDGSYHEYCPLEQVSAEMDRLIEMYQRHQEEKVPPEIEAAWLHHRFTQIHPFQDGNGRVARALATLVVLRAGWFPLVVVSDDRGKYISALEEADHGNLESLVRFFGHLAEGAFLRALRLSEHIVTEQRNYQSMLTALKMRYQQRVKEKNEEYRKVLSTTEVLLQQTSNQFHRLVSDLSGIMTPSNQEFYADVDCVGENSVHWFREQVINLARQLDYYANVRHYHGWVRFKIRDERQMEIVVSFHPIGTEFVGIVGASVFIEYRTREDELVKVEDPHSLVERPFVFTYKDDIHQTSESYEQWLNKVILNGLEEWRQQL